MNLRKPIAGGLLTAMILGLGLTGCGTEGGNGNPGVPRGSGNPASNGQSQILVAMQRCGGVLATVATLQTRTVTDNLANDYFRVGDPVEVKAKLHGDAIPVTQDQYGFYNPSGHISAGVSTDAEFAGGSSVAIHPNHRVAAATFRVYRYPVLTSLAASYTNTTGVATVNGAPLAGAQNFTTDTDQFFVEGTVNGVPVVGGTQNGTTVTNTLVSIGAPAGDLGLGSINAPASALTNGTVPAPPPPSTVVTNTNSTINLESYKFYGTPGLQSFYFETGTLAYNPPAADLSSVKFGQERNLRSIKIHPNGRYAYLLVDLAQVEGLPDPGSLPIPSPVPDSAIVSAIALDVSTTTGANVSTNTTIVNATTSTNVTVTNVSTNTTVTLTQQAVSARQTIHRGLIVPYEINEATGRLTEIPNGATLTPPFTSDPRDIAFGFNGNNMYVSCYRAVDTSTLINTAHGQITRVDTLNGAVADYQIDLSTGKLTLRGSIPVPVGANGLALDRSNLKLYAASTLGEQLGEAVGVNTTGSISTIAINQNTGALSSVIAINKPADCNYPSAILSHPTRDSLYVAQRQLMPQEDFHLIQGFTPNADGSVPVGDPLTDEGPEDFLNADVTRGKVSSYQIDESNGTLSMIAPPATLDGNHVFSPNPYVIGLHNFASMAMDPSGLIIHVGCEADAPAYNDALANTGTKAVGGEFYMTIVNNGFADVTDGNTDASHPKDVVSMQLFNFNLVGIGQTP